MAFDSYEFRSSRSGEQAEAMERLDNGDREALAAMQRAMFNALVNGVEALGAELGERTTSS